MSFRRVLYTAYETEKSSNNVWDDGLHHRVEQISVHYDDDYGISIIKFEYSDPHPDLYGRKTYTQGSYHGHLIMINPKTKRDVFELADDEWIKTVKTYNKDGVRRIEFRTNKKLYVSGLKSSLLPEFGLQVVTYECLANESIVGFHGNNGPCLLNQLGVYFAFAFTY